MRKTGTKSQVSEFKRKIPLAFSVPDGSQYEPMKKNPIPTKLALRPTPEDFAIVTKLREKLGVDNAQIIRIALRRLFESEGLTLKAS